MPSITETFGNVTTEAMASGVPVVAARATGSVDLIRDGETGFLVPPTDVGAYADAMAALIADPAARAAAGQAAHASVQEYRWDSVNAAMCEAYLAVANIRNG
jgi:glycosyltransferase involved in cell wall biosynthesis